MGESDVRKPDAGADDGAVHPTLLFSGSCGVASPIRRATPWALTTWRADTPTTSADISQLFHKPKHRQPVHAHPLSHSARRAQIGG